MNPGGLLVAENDANALVGSFITSDPDRPLQSFSYMLLDDAGGVFKVQTISLFLSD